MLHIAVSTSLPKSPNKLFQKKASLTQTWDTKRSLKVFLASKCDWLHSCAPTPCHSKSKFSMQGSPPGLKTWIWHPGGLSYFRPPVFEVVAGKVYQQEASVSMPKLKAYVLHFPKASQIGLNRIFVQFGNTIQAQHKFGPTSKHIFKITQRTLAQ